MRRLEGERFNVITLKWWGRPRDVPTFEQRHGLRGTFVASSAFLRGLARAVGLAAREEAETDDAAADLRGRVALARERLDALAPVRQWEAADTVRYQPLRSQMDQEWVPQMQQLLDIDTTELPVIWDADFLYGPKNDAGNDAYVLCEVNVSAVWPYPEQATPTVARAAVDAMRTASLNV